MIASNSGPRWRTSTSTSPARAALAPRPALDIARDPAAPAAPAGWSRSARRTARPRPRSRASLGLDQCPRSRPGPAPHRGSASCTVAHVVGGQPAERLRPLEHRVHRAQHIAAGAERVAEVARCAEPLVDRLCSAAAKCRRIASNSRGAAPWNEKIDCFSSPTAKIVRLSRARAGAGEEFRRQRADDLPLLRAGVLRLVDQHVVDAAIELVVHPGGVDVARAAPASCRSGRRSRAGRAGPSRPGSARSPRRRW